MIQNLEEIIRRFCAYSFTHDWCTLIRALELAHIFFNHAPTGNTLAMLEKGRSPKLPVDTLKKYLVDVHPTASSFELLLYKVGHHEKQIMNDSFKYAKQKWNKSQKTQNSK
ncbi:hypothetical protein O181_096421 [Austropuccinia psidii MF-1]|uniref:Uncharacterized protein n=1 Tax=Austropuccinia psidii MF-1 TaxID=1389203 RepID=A0A9Q3J710_9BASI|nr:hypothetical protein [Austropuccinia psidii MF-1]